jgi:GntR family transcriptional regulator, histidine utilization repressor
MRAETKPRGDVTPPKTPVPQYLMIKNYISSGIQSGKWKVEEQVPTEAALVEKFGASRMTVNRALRELAAEQVVFRIRGAGTFVAEPKYESTLIAIRNIADEIRERGHKHSCKVIRLNLVTATALQAAEFKKRAGAKLYRSIIVHAENGIEIQLEDRLVNAALVPDYMNQDFNLTTPNEYLMRVAPLDGVDYRVEAKIPPALICELLSMAQGEPCVVLHRTTWSQGKIATIATMWHPASRYQLVGSF